VSQIALPLAFGVVLLIVLALASRVVDSSRDIWNMAPWFFLVLFVAIAGGFALAVNLSDRQLLDYFFKVLVVGGLVGWGSWRYELRSTARSSRRRREEAIKRWRGMTLEEGRSILPQKGPILTGDPIEHTIDGRGGFFDITEVGLVRL
jgi:hypothetical protein